MNNINKNWWKRENCIDESGMESHTARIWEKIAAIALSKGDIKRAAEAIEAADRQEHT